MSPSLLKEGMEAAFGAAAMSNCKRRKVGACGIIVKDDGIALAIHISANHCISPEHCIRTNIKSGTSTDVCLGVHAEQDLIVSGFFSQYRSGHFKNDVYPSTSTDKRYVFLTNKPCITCLKLLVNSGVNEIYYADDYNDPIVDEYLKYADIQLIQVNNGYSRD